MQNFHLSEFYFGERKNKQHNNYVVIINLSRKINEQNIPVSSLIISVPGKVVWTLLVIDISDCDVVST